MQHNDMRSIAERDAGTDRAIMDLLLIDHPGLWSVGEIERAMGDRIAAHDGLGRLEAAGLIHRLDGGFVFASRAAAHADSLPRRYLR